MAFAANFLRKNPTMLSAALRGVDNTKKAEEQGKTQLEGMFPQNVNSDGISPKVAYVTVNGQRFAVVGYPTYKSNGDGTYTFQSMKCEVRAMKNEEEVKFTDEDLQKCTVIELAAPMQPSNSSVPEDWKSAGHDKDTAAPLTPSNSSVPDDWHSIRDFLNNNNA